MLPAAAPAGRRVLLVELVAIGRFTRERRFPAIHALLRARGTPARWLRFAVPATVQYARGEDGIGLAPEDVTALLTAARELGATDALVSHEPAPALRAALEALPGVRLRVAASLEDGVLLRWLGLASHAGDPAALEAVTPDHGFTPANAAARRMPALGFVGPGSECFHRRRVLDNPVYAGVDLTGCRTTGCAFCTAGSSCDPPSGPITETVLRHARAFLATFPFRDPHARAGLRIPGYRGLRDLAAIAQAVKALDGRPLDLLLDARADLLVAREETLGRAAAELRDTPHRLHVCLVGLESFSRAELERMNKGLEPWVNLAAVRVLRTLESRFPETFRFREHGGLSTILFTPWTTLDDLALNLAVARHMELDEELGKLLHSRLRLYDGLPMAALARRDGLLAEGHGDPALDTARRNFYERELPWRFRDPAVETVNRVAARLDRDASLEGEPLFARVQAWAGARGHLEAAAELVERVRRTPGADVEELITPAPAPEATSSPPPAMGPPAIFSMLHGRRMAELLLVLQRAGLNRVNRLEVVPAAVRSALEEWLRAEGCTVLPVPLLPDARGAQAFDLFFGADPGEVREAQELTALLGPSTDRELVARARTRVGELLGYPRCCSEAFAHLSTSGPTLNEWLTVRRRSEHRDAVPPNVSPLHPALPYVPCSLGCERTRARLDAADAAFRANPATREAFEADGLPVLMLLDRVGQLAKLLPTSTPGPVFDFSGVQLHGDDPRLRALEGGGRMRVDGGAILVERGGERIASFFLGAFLYWNERPFDPELWRELALHVLEPIPPPPAPLEPESGRGAASPLLRRVRDALVRAGGGKAAEHAVETVEPAAGRVLVRLAGPGGAPEPLELYVEPAAGVGHCYRVVGDLALTFAKRTPLRTPAQHRAVAAVSSLLARSR